MKYIDSSHRKFVNKKYSELIKAGKFDPYYCSLIYVLGICEETRSNFLKIFDIKNGEIIPKALTYPWQTSGSLIVTRLAFNLYNNYVFNNENDCEISKVSDLYSVSEIFSSTYAPLFFEAIKIRYPKPWEVNS